ncbi:MAG: hypothetical protein Q8S11_15795 [Daejeonella sp.]|uniref:hypothetical protein n=1 Tax=Daejeonella sp. TaxID=2805397 RepID=UPI002733C4C6|nr:hypothetical protein [Daejeonella sp.]MDP3469804.1 hypothetical protein [Daejeonella sp.]
MQTQEKDDASDKYFQKTAYFANHIYIDIPKIKIFLYFAFLIQLSFNLAVVFLTEAGYTNFYGFKKFYFDDEETIPTYFSAINLLFAGILLALITNLKSRVNDPFTLHWRILSILFVLLSIDEIAGFHEMTIDPLVQTFHLNGYMRFPWVILGVIFMTGFSLYYFQFLKALPKPYIKGFFCSCLIFLGGAIGLETLSAKIFINLEQSPKDLMYNLVTTLEESCEMIGIIMFINMLLSYLKSMKITINFYFKYSE